MGTHFYHFVESIQGNLIFQGKYKMEYFQNIQYGFSILDIDIDEYKGKFLVNRTRTVSSGKTWLNNHLKKLNEKRK